MIRLSTKIYLFTRDENGASEDLVSGVRPNFGINDELITSQFETFEGQAPIFRRGFWAAAKVSLPYGEIYGDAVHPGMTFLIHVGGHRIGVGVVDEILEVFHDPKHAHLTEELQKRSH